MNYGMGPNFGFGPQSGGQFGGFNGYNQCGPMNFTPSNYFQPSYFPAMNWGGGFGFTPPANGWMGPASMGWGMGGMRTWGGTYSPQFMTTGLPTDPEIVEMVYDSMDEDPVIPFDADINVRSDAGTVTLTGMVPSKLVKHAAGDDAWWIPGVDDVQNNLQVVTPQRGRTGETMRGMGEQGPSTPTTRGTRTGTSSTSETPRRGSSTGTTPTRGTSSRGATTGTASRGGTVSRGAKGGTTGTASTSRKAPSATKEKTATGARTATTGTSKTGTSTSGGTGTRTATGTRRTNAT